MSLDPHITGWYSRIEAAYPYRNEIIFGPISITLN